MDTVLVIILTITVIQYFVILGSLRTIKKQNHFLIIKIKKMAETNQEAADKLAAIAEQLTKAKGEIVAKIQALIDAAANANSVDPIVQAAIDNLAPIAQQLDDIVPDAPVEPPVEGGETPTEPEA